MPDGGEPMKWADVSAAALRRNTAAVVGLVGPGCAVMAMVKANAYGHGAVLTARAALAGGATWLGVSSAEEALQLRGAGIEYPTLVVGWTHPSTHAQLVAAGVELAAFDVPSLQSMAAAARMARRPAQVHLKVDTGMHRLGVAAGDLDALLLAVAEHSRDLRVSGVFTHFADADGADPAFTLEQHQGFLPAAARVRDRHAGALVHCANSAAALRFPAMRQDLVRPGLVLYGYVPEHCAGVVEVAPAMTVTAWVTRVFSVSAGATVGYGRTWRAQRVTRVAAVAAGYADGVLRALANRGHMLVRGTLCPVIGAVSMDQVTVDVSGVEEVVPGDRAVVLGPAPDGDRRVDAATVAAWAGTSAYEVLCAVSARVPRRRVEGEGAAAAARCP